MKLAPHRLRKESLTVHCHSLSVTDVLSETKKLDLFVEGKLKRPDGTHQGSTIKEYDRRWHSTNVTD